MPPLQPIAKSRIVLSGVNFNEGGPLSVFRDALNELTRLHGDRYHVIALVHRRALFDTANVTYLEFPHIKSSWLRRLVFEYWQCRALSRSLRPHLWLAMHDITPNVTADIRAVYCHNPAPFHRISLEEARTDSKFALFTLFYQFLYAINLHRNHFVIVQQQWIRDEFHRRYGPANIVVAHPSIPLLASSGADPFPPNPNRPCRFIYPALPRPFKNIELLLEAAELLQQRNAPPFELWLTINGNENHYARKLFARHQHLQSVHWLGLLPRERVMQLYAAADCLLFPSRLETWGMPISEFKQTGKPIFVADLPYAHETVGSYNAVHFFSSRDASALAHTIDLYLRGDLQFPNRIARPVLEPFAPNWKALFNILLTPHQ
ncbi:MAG: glycosyltransferase [Acidobacteriota bacterium]